MKKLCALLCLAALLTGCGTETAPAGTGEPLPAAAETTAPTVETDSFIPEFTEEDPELSHAAYQVVYNVILEETSEIGCFQGIGPEGELVWTYETQSYPMGQFQNIVPIGRYQGTYYLAEASVITALDICTGEVLFQNQDFQGFPVPDTALIDDYGYIYLIGCDTPDFFAMDSQGRTVTRISSLSDQYIRPCRMEIREDQVIVYMEQDLQGKEGNFPCPIPMDWRPEAQG